MIFIGTMLRELPADVSALADELERHLAAIDAMPTAKKPATPTQMLRGIRNQHIDAGALAGGMVCTGFSFTTRPEARAKIIAAVPLGEWLLVPAGHVVKVSVLVKAPKPKRKRPRQSTDDGCLRLEARTAKP